MTIAAYCQCNDLKQLVLKSRLENRLNKTVVKFSLKCQ